MAFASCVNIASPHIDDIRCIQKCFLSGLCVHTDLAFWETRNNQFWKQTPEWKNVKMLVSCECECVHVSHVFTETMACPSVTCNLHAPYSQINMVCSVLFANAHLDRRSFQAENQSSGSGCCRLSPTPREQEEIQILWASHLDDSSCIHRNRASFPPV